LELLLKKLSSLQCLIRMTSVSSQI